MADISVHEQCMHKLCRICGCTLTGKIIHNVKDHTGRLNIAFKYKFEEDTVNIHPELFCHKCYSSLLHFEKRGAKINVTLSSWELHSEKECSTCSRVTSQSKGGRPPKKPKTGRPKQIVNEQQGTINTSAILNLTPSKTIPPEVERIVSHVVNIKMKQSSLPNNTIQLPTKGPQVRII